MQNQWTPALFGTRVSLQQDYQQIKNYRCDENIHPYPADIRLFLNIGLTQKNRRRYSYSPKKQEFRRTSKTLAHAGQYCLPDIHTHLRNRKGTIPENGERVPASG